MLVRLPGIRPDDPYAPALGEQQRHPGRGAARAHVAGYSQEGVRAVAVLLESAA